MNEIDPTDPAQQILFARRWARKVCRDRSWWDVDDLEGRILLDCVRWPPYSIESLTKRASGSTTDWIRERLGRYGQKSHVEHTLSIDRQSSDPDNNLSLLDTIEDRSISPQEVAEAAELVDNLSWMFVGRDEQIVIGILKGYTFAEIGETLGVTESRVSQIITKRIRPTILRILSLRRP